MSFFSGIVDGNEHIRLGGYPAPFRELLGVEVTDFHPLSDSEHVTLEFGDGTQGRGDTWSDDIALQGATAIASSAGRPMLTSHRYGRGTAFYLGTAADANSTARIVLSALSHGGVEPAAEMPQGVEAVRRTGRGKSFLFLLNHREVGVDVPIQVAGTNLVDGTEVHPGLMHIGPRGVSVIREGW